MLKPFFSFYGGKWRAAPHYPSPTRKIIIEPFAGSAGYATRYANRKIILTERDPVIASLWRYLISVTDSEIRGLPLIGAGEMVDDLKVCQEAKYLIGFWLNKGNTQPCKSASAWVRKALAGEDTSSCWNLEIRERIARQVNLIRHWQIIEGDYACAPDVEATWFIDPPYAKAGKCYKESSKNINYESLGQWCRARRGQTLVCENVGADWLPFRFFLDAKGTEGIDRVGRSQEAIWTYDTRSKEFEEASARRVAETLKRLQEVIDGFKSAA